MFHRNSFDARRNAPNPQSYVAENSSVSSSQLNESQRLRSGHRAIVYDIRSSSFFEIDDPKRKCSVATVITPLLSFFAIFLNFVFVPIEKISDKYSTLVTPPGWAFQIWGIIYMFLLIFIFSQLFVRRLRNSRLIQRRLPTPWILSQVCTGVWFVTFAREYMYLAAGVLCLEWLLLLIAITLIRREFAHNISYPYKYSDKWCVEIPFLLLFGWITVAAVIMVNIAVLKLARDNYVTPESDEKFQIGAAILSVFFLFIVGLSFTAIKEVRNGVVQLPIAWGLFSIGMRLFAKIDLGPQSRLAWLPDTARLCLAYASFVAAALLVVFAVVGACLVASGRPAWRPSLKRRSELLSSRYAPRRGSSGSSREGLATRQAQPDILPVDREFQSAKTHMSGFPTRHVYAANDGSLQLSASPNFGLLYPQQVPQNFFGESSVTRATPPHSQLSGSSGFAMRCLSAAQPVLSSIRSRTPKSVRLSMADSILDV